MIINVNEDTLFKKRDLQTIFPHEFSNRWLIKQFITYVMNHFFEKSHEKHISSYIGEYVKNIDGETCYINEPTQERQLNQLIPFVKYGDNITNYENFLANLNNEGCLVENTNKLLSGKHWSWCPPINLDMFINYIYYYWIGSNTLEKESIIIDGEVNVEKDILGKETYTYIKKNKNGLIDVNSKYKFKNGDVVVFLKDKSQNYNKVPYVVNGVGSKIKLLPIATPLYYIDGETNIINDIIGKKKYHYVDTTGYGKDFDFINGMRLMILNDVNTEYNNKIYIVDGVGTKINLIEDVYDDDFNPNYHTIERGSLDHNRWSETNRWVHKSVIETLNIGSISTSTSSGYKEYNENDEYEQGDFVLYNNNIYMCQNIKTESGKFEESDWKFITQVRLNHAEYPIICFNKNLELYNHGTKHIVDVDYVFNEKSVEISGKSENDLALMFGITSNELVAGMKILCINNDTNDGHIFMVNKININGVMTVLLQNETFGKSNSGDCVYVKQSSKNYPKSMLHYNGLKWIVSQTLEETNQSPLFNLYDYEKELFSNTVIYPKSTFSGSKIFDYVDVEIDEDSKYIEQLNRYVKKDDFVDYNFKFNNYLTTDVIKYTPYKEYETEIKGYKFLKRIDDGSFINDWYVSEDKDTTYLKTRVISEIDGTLLIKLLYNISKNEIREPIMIYINGDMITDFTYDEKNVTINNVSKNDVIDVKFLTSDSIKNLNSSYVFEQPLSITVNQMNKEVETIAYNNCFDQMVDIIQHQYGIVGNGFGDNNYSSISHNLSVGTKIVQHSESLLKTMFLVNNPSTSIRASIEYAMSSYSMFKLKFENVINNMYKSGRINDLDFTPDNTDQLDEIIKEVISKINLGKEGLMPCYNNGVLHLIENAYIPSTPAYLGLTGCYKPRYEVFLDHFKEEKPRIIINHDGSFRNVTNTIKDEVFLRLETLIYDSIHSKLKDRKNGVNKLKFLPGKFRDTIYNRDDVLDVYSQHFNLWAHLNELRYDEHYKFDYNLESNKDAWKTWNYTDCKDVDGDKLFGSYRSVYTYYYDTYRPDTHPWEMLGFDDKPSWWKTQYGSYPYTSMNKIMWNDIENGIIKDGKNKGEYIELKRKGLVEKYLPVDELGRLKNPMDIGIIKNIPFLQNAKKPWKIGDMGEMEFIYQQTSEYKYVQELITYLLRPCEWVETNWNTIDREVLFENTNNEQIINSITKLRENLNNIYIHNELIDNKNIRKIGLQQWVSDYIISDNKDISTFGNELRNIQVNLGYRCAGYYQKDSLKVISDPYGEIPSENIHMSIFKSSIEKTVTYSGIKIIKTQAGYMIDGFDKTYPYFKMRVPFYNGKKASVEEDGVTVFYYNNYSDEIKLVPYKTEYKTIQDVYTFINGYSKYLEDNEGWYFTTILPSGEVSDFRISSKSFLVWAKAQIGEETNGNVILLNPAGYGVGNYNQGVVESMGLKVSGRSSAVDIEGQPIKSNELTLMRNPYNTYIKSDTKLIGYLKLKMVQYEHIVLFDNETIFNDILYDPKYSSMITRLKLLGIKVKNWYGSLYAPGYIVTDDGAIENYDKKASDLQYIFDVDDVRCSGKIEEYSKAIIGYQTTKMFKDLFQNNKSMFDFYKGSIAEKGTKNVINKMNRSTHISSTGDDVTIYENWLFKAGEFGYTTDKSVIEYLFDTTKMNKNSQIITLQTQVSNYYDKEKTYNINDEVVYKSYKYRCIEETKSSEFDSSKWKKLSYVGNYIISWDDEKWIKKPKNKEKLLDLTDNRFTNPTGGYVNIEDCQYIVSDESLLTYQSMAMKDGEVIWVVKKSDGDWDILRKTGVNKLVSLRYPSLDEAYGQKKISNVYHFTDNKTDYYTDKNKDEAELNPLDTKIYTDIDLTYGEKRYSDIDIPRQVDDEYYLYKSGEKYKIKLNNTIFETLEPQEKINKESLIWYLGIDKENMAFEYKNTLLTMTTFGKDFYDYQYVFSVSTESNVMNPKITINGLTFNEKTATAIINSGDTVTWKIEAYGCETRHGSLKIPDLNNMGEEAMNHSEKVDLIVPMNYVKNATLSEHKSNKETVLPLTSEGTYRLVLVSAGGGAGGGSWYNGSFKRKKYSIGGGGSSGGYAMIDFTITKDILNLNRKYVIYTGKGGVGGKATKKSGYNGGIGESTYFGYYDTNNKLVKLCEVLGGTGNYGGYQGGNITVDGRPLSQGGFLNMSMLNNETSKEYQIKVIEYKNGSNVPANVSSGAKMFVKNGVYYGVGGNGVYKKDGLSGSDGYSSLKYISDTKNETIVENKDMPIGKKFSKSDSKDYVAYNQKYIDENNYFYSYDIMYRDDNVNESVNEDLNILNPSSIFYKNRCRSITAKHKSSVSKNLFTNTPGKKYELGNTVTYDGKYYVCTYAHISDGQFKETITVINENGETNEVVVWNEYIPTYYYKITDNNINGTNKTTPESYYRLYEDSSCSTFVSKDDGEFYMTCNDLQIPTDEKELEYVLGDRYYLVDPFCTYYDIEPKYLTEPNWGTINHNGYYSVTSGGIEYFVKYGEDDMNSIVSLYNEQKELLLTLKDTDNNEEIENIEKIISECEEKMYLYSDNNCQSIAMRKTSKIVNGSLINGVLFDKVEKFEDVNMLYIDIINVVEDNYEKCYKYTDKEITLYSTKQETDITIDPTTEMYYDPDLLESAGKYKDYTPIWTMCSTLDENGEQVLTNDCKVVNTIEHLKDGDIIYIDNECFSKRNAGGSIVYEDEIIGHLTQENKLYKNNLLIGVIKNNILYKDKDIKVGVLSENNLYYNDGSLIGTIGDTCYIKDNIVYMKGNIDDIIIGYIKNNMIYTTGVEKIGYLDEENKIYYNDGSLIGNLIYNIKRLSDTQNIGSGYGCYSKNDEYGWIKAKYLGDDYLVDGTKFKFDIYDMEKRLIDIDSIDSVFIVDDKTDKTLTKVQLYDPIQNIIPNNVLDEVHFISSTDPVIDYNDSGKWSDANVGLLWWDTSSVRYVDYHIGDLRYRYENWGKQLVGSQIIINEWYRDVTPPTDGRNYVIKTIYNENTNTMETYYYYWLQNPTTTPSLTFRNNSAYTIARTIANPSDLGIVWMAPIELNNSDTSKLSMIICEYNNVLIDDDCALQLNINRKNVTKHAEWLRISENTTSNIPNFLWNKLRESLLGYKTIDGEKVNVPDPTLTTRNSLGLSNRPRQSMFKDIYNARRNFIDVINEVFESRTIENISKDVSSSLVLLKDEYTNRDIIYDYEASTKLEMMNWNDENLIGNKVLVKYDETHDNIWVLYRIDSINDGENGYIVEDYQKYDIKKYLEYKDWYQDIEIKSIVPTYVTNDIGMVNKYLDELEIGRIVKYQNGNEWRLYQKSKNIKTNIVETNIVGISNTILNIKESIYNFVNQNIDDKEIYIDGKTQYEYIEEETNVLLENIIDYFGKV